MAAFTCQDWPATAHACSVVSAAIVFLAIAVVIVTAPARTLRQVVLENAIYYFDRIKHERIIRPPNSITNQMKEIAAHDVSRRMETAAVGDLYHLCVGIGMGIRFIRIGWINSDVMARYAWHQLARCRDHPFF